MMKKRELLIVCKNQFGYHTDVFKWCEHLKSEYAITTLTFDDGGERVYMQNVRNIYVPNAGNRVLRGIFFMIYSTFVALCFRGTILVCFFAECILLKRLRPYKRMILDIRTLDVSEEAENRRKQDFALKRCVQLYDFVTCISEGVRKKIDVPRSKSAILPLGADIVYSGEKKFNEIRLLYVGTLYNRNIEKTVEGLAIAMRRMDANASIEYDIIGTGLGNELDILKSEVEKYGLSQRVHIHGYVRHDLLVPFFEKCNVGVSFVPITDYYEYQPPTKTYEYALSGLYVIATDTFANRGIINSENGCLIQDTPSAFAEAILSLHLQNKESNRIRNSVGRFQWRKIVDEIMKPILASYGE